MTGVQGSVGGENWCVYEDLNPYSRYGSNYELWHGMGWFCSGTGFSEGLAWKVFMIMLFAMNPEKIFWDCPPMVGTGEYMIHQRTLE